MCCFASEETLESIEKTRAASLPGNRDGDNALSRKIRGFSRRDKVRQGMSHTKQIEIHLNVNYFRFTHKALK